MSDLTLESLNSAELKDMLCPASHTGSTAPQSIWQSDAVSVAFKVPKMPHSFSPLNTVSGQKQDLLCALYGPRNFNVRVTIETKAANYLNRFQRFGLFSLGKTKELRSKRRPECTCGPAAIYPDDRGETDRPGWKINADSPRRANARDWVSFPNKISEQVKSRGIGSAKKNRSRL